MRKEGGGVGSESESENESGNGNERAKKIDASECFAFPFISGVEGGVERSGS